MFISVLLPLPELPMIATRSPVSMRSETSAQRAHADLSELVGLADVVHADDRMLADDARARRADA